MTHPRIIRFEESIRRLPREKCCIFSSDGQVIFEKESQVDGLREICSFSDKEYQMMTRQILTHNHPSGLLFSYPDIEMAVKAELSNLRLVTISGTFSIMPPTQGWIDVTKIWDTHRGIINNWDYIPSLAQYFEEHAPNEGFNFSDREWYLQHLAWEIVAKKIGLVYQRTLWQG